MAIIGFPYNSQNRDRAIKAEVYRRLLSKYFTTGVFPNPSTQCQVVAGGAMNVTVKKGSANINGLYIELEEDVTVAVNAPDTLDRYDRIVLRNDDNTTVRAPSVVVIKGTPSESPQPPALTRNDTVYDICLATVKISQMDSKVEDYNIEDTRSNTDLCGIVSATIESIDTTTFYNQIQADLKSFKENEQADFQEWFDTIKGILGTDEAGNLLLMIQSNTSRISANEKNVVNLTNVLNSEISRATSKDSELSSRIDQLIAPTESEITLDAEVIDTRVGFDGLKYENAGNAVRGQTNQMLKNIDNLKKGFDMLLFPDWEKGFIDSSGNDLESDRYERTSTYHQIKAGTPISITVGNECGAILRYYDRNKTYLYSNTVEASSVGEYATRNVVVSENVEYVRVTVTPIDESHSATVLKSGLTILKTYIGSLIPNKQGFIISSPYNKSQIKVDTLSKTITFSDKTAYCYILHGNDPVDIRGKVVNYESIESEYGYILFDFDTNDFVLINASVNSITNMPSNCVQVGFIWNVGKSIVLNAYPYYFVNGLKTTMTDHEGVFTDFFRIAVLGDSISTFVGYSEDNLYEEFYPKDDVNTVEDIWWKIVANQLRVNYVSVSAVSSSQFNTVSGNERPPLWDDSRIDRLGSNGEPNIIFVEGGTNDPFTNKLGTNTYSYSVEKLDSEPESTIRGCALTIRKLQDAYPNSRIIGLIPAFVDVEKVDNENYTFESFTKVCNGIKEIYLQYGCEVIDLRECGINYTNNSEYTIDGTHPNAKGMGKIADFIIKKIITK